MYNDDKYFQDLVLAVFSKLAENTITFKNVGNKLNESENQLRFDYTKHLYDCFKEDKDRNEIDKVFSELESIIKDQKSRFSELYNKRKSINEILKLNDYTLSEKDIRYIFDGIID